MMLGICETERKGPNMQKSDAGKSIPQSQSGMQSDPPGKQEISASFSKDLATQLLDLMKKVTKDEVNPQTVHAACSCASEIHKILALNYRIKRGV